MCNGCQMSMCSCGGEEEGVLGALGKGGGCWICGGTHFQRECPYKGKGKGKAEGFKGVGLKGGTKGDGGGWKGKGKGQIPPWMFGGPVDKGKGKGVSEVKGGKAAHKFVKGPVQPPVGLLDERVEEPFHFRATAPYANFCTIAC